MLTILILSMLFGAWALLTCTFLVIGFIYGCLFGIIDLILLSPFILAATPVVIIVAIIAIVIIARKIAKKKRTVQISFDVVA